MTVKVEIPGTILIVDDKITESKSDPNFSLYKFNKILLKNGYNTILAEPDTIITMEVDHQNLLKDISILIIDLTFRNGTNLDSKDEKTIIKVINKILENRSRLIVIYLSTLFSKTDVIRNESLTKSIEENFIEKSDKVQFIGRIPKSIFENEKESEIIKIFSDNLESHLNQLEISDRVLLFHWECIIRNSIDRTINQIYSSGENSIKELCSNVLDSIIRPKQAKNTENHHKLVMSLKTNELFSSILNSEMKDEIQNNIDNNFTNIIVDIVNNISPRKEYKEKKLPIVEKSKINSVLTSAKDLLKNQNFSGALEKINSILRFDKENQNAKSLKKDIVENLKRIGYNDSYWKTNFYTLLNFRFIENNPNLSFFPIFPGLVLIYNNNKKRKSGILESYVVITPKCDIPHNKTHFMTCIKLFLNIKSNCEVKATHINEYNYYTKLLKEIEIEDMEMKNALKNSLYKNDKVIYDRFYSFKYTDEKTNFLKLGIIDFSQVKSIPIDELNSEFQPNMIIEDDLLNDIRIHYVKYINRFGIFDFIKPN